MSKVKYYYKKIYDIFQTKKLSMKKILIYNNNV